MFIIRLVVMIALTGFSGAAFSADEIKPDWNANTLTGDWNGKRASLYSNGVDLGFTHKSDFMSNTSGGIKRGTVWMGHTEARINIDMEKLWGWNATTAFIQFHSQLGSFFNRDYVGGLGVDNIETTGNTGQFFNAWVQKSLADDALSVLAGLYAIDSEFYVTDTTAVFTQPPYGMANEVAQSGKNGPPIYPVGAFGLRVKYNSPGKVFYAQYAVTDGVPGADPTSALSYRGTHVQLGNGDGTLSIMEFGLTPQRAKPETAPQEEGEYFNKTALGCWRYTSHLADLAGGTSSYPSQGAYILSEHTLMIEKDHPDQGLSGFVRFGMASKDVHQSDWTGSLGLRYHGLIAERDGDIAGIAVTVNHASEKFRAYGLSPQIAKQRETDIELTYRAELKPWFALQPTLQYIMNPNMDPSLSNAKIIGVRVEINL